MPLVTESVGGERKINCFRYSTSPEQWLAGAPEAVVSGGLTDVSSDTSVACICVALSEETSSRGRNWLSRFSRSPLRFLSEVNRASPVDLADDGRSLAVEDGSLERLNTNQPHPCKMKMRLAIE